MTTMKELVVKLNICDDKEKRKVMKAVSGFLGLNYLGVEMKEKKLTVIGDFDPIEVVNKLRKLLSHADIVSIGPVKESGDKKDEAEKKEKAARNPFLSYQAYPYPYQPITSFYLPPVQEYPNTYAPYYKLLTEV